MAEQPEKPSQNPNDKSKTEKPRLEPSKNSQTPALNTRHKKFVLIALLIGLLAWIGAGTALYYRDAFTPAPDVTERQRIERDGNITKSEEEVAIANVIDKAAPSVVSIVTQVNVRSIFYGNSVQEGAGSGIIVAADGYILTNRHVVDDAQSVAVVLSDGTMYEDVEVVTTDPLNDIAFLKVPDVTDLPVAELGDSTTVRVGQTVIAIGNSLGQYQNTVTSGIISGTGRPVSAQGSGNSSVETLTDLLQTDAAINPGNSGGPLLNTSGQVIGLNTAVARNAEGIGFAIPISATKGLLKQVLAGEEARRSYFGIRYVPVNAAVAKDSNLSVKRGALVTSEGRESSVARGGPADDAGIQEGDVITKINDVEVGIGAGVASLVAEYAPGDVIEVTFVRGEETQTVRVTLGAY